MDNGLCQTSIEVCKLSLETCYVYVYAQGEEFIKSRLGLVNKNDLLTSSELRSKSRYAY